MRILLDGSLTRLCLIGIGSALSTHINVSVWGLSPTRPYATTLLLGLILILAIPVIANVATRTWVLHILWHTE